MKSYVFKVVVEDDEFEDGRPAFHAYCPALVSLGAATWGHTRKEALKNIGEVIQMVVDELVEEGKEIPLDVAEIDSPAVVATVRTFRRVSLPANWFMRSKPTASSMSAPKAATAASNILTGAALAFQPTGNRLHSLLERFAR